MDGFLGVSAMIDIRTAEAKDWEPDICYFMATGKEAVTGFVSVHFQKLRHHASGIAKLQEVFATKHLQGKG